MSMNLSDLYGGPSAAVTRADPVTVSGPNQGAVANPSSPASGAAGKGAAFSWVGFAIALVIIRVLIESGGRKSGVMS